ncbi:phage tail sheath family protein [Lactobacillus sp. PV034]|uniref:phage tail sheath family protein n=1 Tax=Lactobacillus sp. PV034 TaxID=2594495 RepID=UPI00223F8EF2|nr:phage tail sheath family protein [Lactobacillus sp. PV034]QNQ80782.1 phage tail protein [Lactobacillus sp. PV034]
MAGTWKAQNKRRPGAYVNVKGTGDATSESSVGRLLMISDASLDWGAKGIISLTSGSNFKAKLGTDLDNEQLLALKEALKGAETVLFLNPNGGEAAKGTAENSPFNFTANYPGLKGNDISVSIEPEIVVNGAMPTKATVTTLFGASIVDQRIITATDIEKFSNDFVTATPVDNPVLPTSAISIKLSDGITNKVEVTDLLNDALENENYSVVTTGGIDTKSNIHALLVEAVKRLREDEGIKVRAVVPGDDSTTTYNYEGVSVVGNGFVESDGRIIDTTNAAAFFAGVSASADAGTSLTYYTVSDAMEASPKLNNEKTINALNAGQIVFTTRPGQRVVVEQDINSLTKFTADRPKEFSKNRVIRTIDDICTNSVDVFEQTFLGKVGNDANGRDLFKANRIAYLSNLQQNGIIQSFDNADVVVEKGNDSDSILVNIAVIPVDSMEKLYMTLVVR